MIAPTDVNTKSQAARISVTIEAGDKEFEFGVIGSRSGQHSGELGFIRAMGKSAGSESPGPYDLAEQYRNRLVDNSLASVPTVVLYRVARAVTDIPLRVRGRTKFDQISVYDGAFDAQRNFRTFFEWFRLQEDLEAESFRDKPDSPDRQLEAVREAIRAFMPGYDDLRVRRSPLRMTLSKNGESLLVSQLSDGEKVLLSLVGDLARRLAVANPGFAKPLHGEGVVLIDEIELHLHPAWQRHVIEHLPTVFPNIQFFVTTHSPVVANSAPPNSMFLLQDGIIEPFEAYGQDVAVVLSDVFGTELRPAAVQHQIDNLFVAIERDPANAEPLLTNLAKLLPPQDAVLVRARARLARKAG